MKTASSALSFIILVSLFIITSLTAQPSLEKLEAKADEICASWQSDGPGGVIGIVENGELVFSKAYGLASLEYEIPNITSTVFNIASVSKQFTAYSMVLLEQQGKLSIDDDIRKYLPEIPDFGETITIRHLLNHISGLRNFQNLLGMAGWREGESMTNDDLLKYMSLQKELNFPVGSEYLYCNSGFVLVTFIVERITGMSFQEWTKANIFNPLGMTNTEYREDMEAIHQNTATSYAKNEDGTFRQLLKYWTYMGNGNVYTTVDDLAIWVANFENHTLGGPEGINRLLERGILTNGDTLTYALGIGINKYRGLNRYSHGGSVGGYRSNFAYYPGSKTGFIVMANFSAADAGGKAIQLQDYYLEEKFNVPKSSTPPRYVHLTSPIDIDPVAFEMVTGEYLVEGVTVKIFSEEGNMFAHAIGITPVLPLQAASDTSFFVPDAALTFYIRKEAGENPDRLIILRDSDVLGGYKIDPSLITPENLKQFEGIYYSPELNTEYNFKIKDDKLMSFHQRHTPAQIYPMNKDKLRGEAFYLSEIDVVRWTDGSVKGIQVSNGRVRNLWFEKRQ